MPTIGKLGTTFFARMYVPVETKMAAFVRAHDATDAYPVANQLSLRLRDLLAAMTLTCRFMYLETTSQQSACDHVACSEERVPSSYSNLQADWYRVASH